MFSTFKILAIYLIISSICTCIPILNGETTTFNFKEKVKAVSRGNLDYECILVSHYTMVLYFLGVGPLKDDLKKMIDPLTNNDDKIELKGKLQGKMEKIIERAVEAAHRIEHLNFEKGGLHNQKEEADKYKLLLGLTYRIDYLESLLAPGLDFKGKQRRVRWLTIFSLKTPAVEKIKKKVEDAGMTELAFAECIEKLCNECNTRAAHARIPLSKIVSEKTIEEALAIMEIVDDKPVVDTVKIIVAPVEASDLTTTTTTQKS